MAGFLCLAAASCAPEASAAAELVVVAGQSNALGFKVGPGDLPPEHRIADPRVRIWTGRGFAAMQPGVNTGAPGSPASWGPEVAFANRWLADHPAGTLYLVKHARGSTPLHPGPGSDWAPESGELFGDVEATVQAAKAALARDGVAIRVTTILWMQGEADAHDALASERYGHGLEQLILEARRRWGEASTSFVIGQTSSHRPFGAAVRAAQSDVASRLGRVGLVDTDSYPLQADDLHLSAVGQLRLGAEMYAASRRQVGRR